MALRSLLLLLGSSVVAGAERAPHLVLFVLDDVGWSDVSYHGGDFPTPHIDALATKEGVRLERYYVENVCSPTRSAFMTGRYPFHTGMQHKTTLIPGTLAHLPLDRPTTAEALRKVGYRTHAIGKWHLGYASWNYTPTGRGFESHAGYFQGQGDHYKHTLASGDPDPQMLSGFDFWRNQTAARDAVGTYGADFYQAEAERILNNHDPSEPLFLYYANQEDHVPLQSPPEKAYDENCAAVDKSGKDGKNRHILCTMASRLDKSIADLVLLLKGKGMWDDTVMWVSTDNGGMTQWGPTAIEASAASNYPLRGGKATLFEGGVRVVGFVTGGRVPAAARGSVRGALTHFVQHVDVAATFAQLAGADLGDIDGVDAWGVITTGADSARTEVPCDINVKSGFFCLIKFEDGVAWKLIEGNCCTPGARADGWWSNDPYTYEKPNATEAAVTVGGKDTWLFNLGDDENERANLAAEKPDVAGALRARIAGLSDPASGYLDPQYNVAQPEGAAELHNHTWAPWLDA